MSDKSDKKEGKSRVIDNGDPFYLQSSDTPGTPLVSNSLNGDNYMAWSRSMKIALGAKLKLGFMDDRSVKPSEDSPDYEQWIRVDCMVQAWILSSMSKDLVDAFLYTTSARELWKELEVRFGECNGPMLYQLQREISSISQGNMTVAQYFTRLKKLWDELQALQPLSACSCGASEQIGEYMSSGRLLQFLMGLNDSFDHIRNQILVMDPLPDVNKTYSMILRIEKQREVQNSYSEITENSAMFVNQSKLKLENGNNFSKKPSTAVKPNFPMKVDKSGVVCGKCHYTGHTEETCFQIHGVPDWYKKLVEEKKARQKNFVNLAEIGKGHQVVNEKNNAEEMSIKIQDMIQSEFHKFISGK